MLKKTITYQDFNGEEVSEDFFFHLSKAELVELELSHKGGLSEALQRIVEAEDGKSIIREFKNIILSSYGKRSDDGRRFIKNQELRDEFESSEAYSVMFMELVTNTDSAVEFVNGVMPADMVAQAVQIVETDAPPLKVVTEPRVVTRLEIQAMSQEELTQLGTSLASGEAVLGE